VTDVVARQLDVGVQIVVRAGASTTTLLLDDDDAVELAEQLTAINDRRDDGERR
jgi:hypothetical protein